MSSKEQNSFLYSGVRFSNLVSGTEKREWAWIHQPSLEGIYWTCDSKGSQVCRLLGWAETHKVDVETF